MIPFFESHQYFLGPLRLQTWGTFVAIGFLAGTFIASRRASKKGLDPAVVWDLAFWAFLSAMVGSRLFHVIFYEPVYYLAHPLEIINPLAPGYAIFGGFAGAASAVWFFAKRKGLDFLAYADIMAWGLPWGCGIGRIGCFLIHDHPGTLTSFVGAVKYPGGSRHDLGLYLSVFGFVLGLVFLLLDRKPRRKGFWVVAFLVAESLSRFFLDFLRVADTRYGPLTPTQWTVILIFSLCLLLNKRKKFFS